MPCPVRTTLRLLPLLLLLVAPPARPAEPPAAVRDRDDAPAGGVPVSFRGEVLFELAPGVGAIDAALRAARIEGRVARAVEAGRAGAEVRVEERTGATDVLAGPDFVFSITDEDAARAGVSRAALAAERAAALARTLDLAAKEATPRSLGLALARSAAASAVLALALGLARLVTRRLRLRVARMARHAARDPRRARWGFLSPARVARAVSAALRLAFLALAVIAVVAWLEYLLVQFPWTRAAARAGLRVVLDALSQVVGGIVGYLPKLVYIGVIVVAARLVLGALATTARQIERGRFVLRGFHADWARPTFQLLRVLVLAVAAVAAFPYLPGSGSPAFQAISIFVGVLVSLGSSSSVANVVAGVILTYMRPYTVGDRIRVADAEGMVLERSLLVTRLRTDKSEEITLPNATVLSGHVQNYSARARGAGLIVHTSVTIGYSTPWRRVHELLLGAAADAAGSGLVRTDPPPFVLRRSLDDFYVRYELNAATSRPEVLPAVYARLHEAIQDRFAAAGVEIMSPHYAALRDGHAHALPPGSPAAEPPGAFRVAGPKGG
jgi:small-conductance mechanosensitive channel